MSTNFKEKSDDSDNFEYPKQWSQFIIYTHNK